MVAENQKKTISQHMKNCEIQKKEKKNYEIQCS